MTFGKDQEYCVLDYETYSEAELKKVGAWEYSLHPSTEILCLAWRMGTRDNLRQMSTCKWAPGIGSPQELLMAFEDPSVVLVAHNALFEQVITKHVLAREFYTKKFLAHLPPERWVCTASLARALAIPGNLEGAAKVMGLKTQKDMEGNRLIKKWCKPRKPTKHDPSTRHADPAELLRLMDYCVTDVDTEVELFLACPPLHPTERQVWVMDQYINMRGFQVDRPLVKTALKLIDEEAVYLNQRTDELTFGALRSANQRGAVLEWLEENGTFLPDLKKKTVEDAITDGLVEGDCKEMLEIRLAISKTSTAKYQAFEQRSRSDGRLRDILIYHAASPGRWGGTGIQPQNFPRGTLKNSVAASEVMATGDLEWIRTLYGSPMDVFSSCLRNMIIAPEGKVLDVADYAAIEARVLFWVADHHAGVKAFKDGRKMYEELAAKIYCKKVTDIGKESPERFVGKQATLGCLAAGTNVLTRSGWKLIQSIDISDELWDGEQWVKHNGVAFQGHKNVINVWNLGIESTPDHWFHLNGMWQTALEVSTQPHPEGRNSEPSRLPGVKFASGQNAVSLSAAYAEMKKQSGLISCGWVKRLLASIAHSLSTGKKAETQTEILTWWLTHGLEHVGQLASSTSGRDVTDLMIKTTRGMAVAALPNPSGLCEIFWNILLHLMGLKSPGSRWTELIMTGVMNPETYESLLRKSTTKTVETFDVLDAGPNNRFCVASIYGEIIAHNCGYTMGWKKFQATCKQLGQEVSDEVAQLAVKAYRTEHWPVVKLWGMLEKAAIAATLSPWKKYSVNHTSWFVRGNFLFCQLPSGRRLAYYGPTIRYEPLPWGDERAPKLYHWGVDSLSKKWVNAGTYGGKLTENVVQAISRDLMADAMLRIEAAGPWQIVLSVHDELVAERDVFSSDTNEQFRKLMETLPPWAAGCPVKVESWEGKRYRK